MTQTDIFGYLYPNYKITKPIRLIELFAGVGTQAMALRDLEADFTRHRVVEMDPFAIKSYNAIHGASFGSSDITQIHGVDLDVSDKDKYEYIMTYSFPCQDLSLAGKGQGMEKGSGTRSSLLWEVERILLELKERNELPQVLVMENVPEVIGAKNYQHFMKWYSSLEQMGYQSYYKLLNAKDYGVPHSFKRTGCKGCPYALELQEQLEVMYTLMPEEYRQCELIWKPVYDEYRRIGYRLKKAIEPVLPLGV